MENFLGIYWAGTSRFIFLPLFILAIWMVVKNFHKIKTSINSFVHSKNIKIIFNNFSLKKLYIKHLALTITLVCIFIAILQPQWGKKETKVMQEGRDLLIALDISRSMLARDLKPSRLEFTKLKIRNLLKRLNFERVGLILFSGSAFLQCPLTADHTAFLMFLDQVDTETISSGTTAMDSAISKAIDIFSHNNRQNKLVLLATDGEDFSQNLESIKQKAKKNDIKIFALGVGTTQGAPIPKLDNKGNQIGHEKDNNGNIALSVLNEKKLQQLTKELNGNYFKMTYNDSDINTLSQRIQKFEKEKFEDKKISYYEDQYPWLLGIAFILLLLEWIL